jgi:hypothetical protein
VYKEERERAGLPLHFEHFCRRKNQDQPACRIRYLLPPVTVNPTADA